VPLAGAQDVRAEKGVLTLTHGGQALALKLGDQAERWAARIAHPPSRLDKLGVKPGLRVQAIGLDGDASFLGEVRGRGATLVTRGAADLVFYRIESARELARLSPLAKAIEPDGAIWVLWPKGRKELREDDVRAAALALTLVDVKVVSFSDVLSGLKLVVRKALQAAAGKAAPAKARPAARRKEA